MVHLIHIFGSAFQRLLLNFLIFFKRERLLFLSDSSPHEEVIYIDGIILFCLLATAKLFLVCAAKTGHFRVSKALTFKTRLSAKLLI